jgi:hypothetical protein
MDHIPEPPATMSWKAVPEIIGVLIGAAVLTLAAVNLIVGAIWFWGA